MRPPDIGSTTVDSMAGAWAISQVMQVSCGALIACSVACTNSTHCDNSSARISASIWMPVALFAIPDLLFMNIKDRRGRTKFTTASLGLVSHMLYSNICLIRQKPGPKNPETHAQTKQNPCLKGP